LLFCFFKLFVFIGQFAVKHANEDRNKYVQIYAHTHDQFIAFEKKQLIQMRNLLSILTSDQHKILAGTKFYSLKIDFALILLFWQKASNQMIHLPQQ